MLSASSAGTVDGNDWFRSNLYCWLIYQYIGLVLIVIIKVWAFIYRQGNRWHREWRLVLCASVLEELWDEFKNSPWVLFSNYNAWKPGVWVWANTLISVIKVTSPSVRPHSINCHQPMEWELRTLIPVHGFMWYFLIQLYVCFIHFTSISEVQYDYCCNFWHSCKGNILHSVKILLIQQCLDILHLGMFTCAGPTQQKQGKTL